MPVLHGKGQTLSVLRQVRIRTQVMKYLNSNRIFIYSVYVLYPCIKGYLNLCNNTYKCTRIKYVLSHIINYRHVSIAFTIIISLKRSPLGYTLLLSTQNSSQYCSALLLVQPPGIRKLNHSTDRITQYSSQ